MAFLFLFCWVYATKTKIIDYTDYVALRGSDLDLLIFLIHTCLYGMITEFDS